MTTRAEWFTNTSAEFLAKAEDALSKDDLLQASEKAWGAAAHMVRAVAARRRWRHAGHRELFQVVNRLVEETGDRELVRLFHVANSLHSNFYEDWMTQEFVEQGLDQVRELVDRLERIA
jgi:uncharacterized protein (UPF0332 family)